MSKQSWVFIINPVAGNGFAGEYADTVKAMIKQHNIDAVVQITKRRGEAIEIADHYVKQGFHHIIAVGGDGTLYKEQDMRLTLNEKTQETKSFLNTIANGRRLAGGFYLTPDAFANDGLLDICMINKLSIPGRIKELIRVIKKKHTEGEAVDYFSTNRLTFEFDWEVPAHLDGEMYFESRFEVSILSRHLKTIYNPYGNHYFEIS